VVQLFVLYPIEARAGLVALAVRRTTLRRSWRPISRGGLAAPVSC